jgi:hypothetical protein
MHSSGCFGNPQVSGPRIAIDHALTAAVTPGNFNQGEILVLGPTATAERRRSSEDGCPGRELAMSTFPENLRKVLHNGPKEELKQLRIDRNALDARVKAEYLVTYLRDISGTGRIDPDRRIPRPTAESSGFPTAA